MSLLEHHADWTRQFHKSVDLFMKGDLSLRTLACELCQLGVGKYFDGDNNLIYPQKSEDQKFNEVIHSMLEDHNLLDLLRGYFIYDCELCESNNLKIASKPYDYDLTLFLVSCPDVRYFTKTFYKNACIS